MDYYFAYYLLSIGLAWATDNPAPAALVVVFWLLRPWLPDPVVWLRSFGAMRSLEAQLRANPHDMIAARRLATLYLELKRPARAAAMVERMRERAAESTRHPLGSREDAELLVVLGRARLAANEPEAALAPLVAAVEIAPDVGWGEPFVIAAEALSRLERHAEAEDSLTRFVETNRSSVSARVELAAVRRRRGDRAGARHALDEAIDTYRTLPAFKQRAELPARLRATWMSLVV